MSDCEIIAKLNLENSELRNALTDSLGPTIAHCVGYQFDHGLPEVHPVHAELIARIKRLTAENSNTPPTYSEMMDRVYRAAHKKD